MRILIPLSLFTMLAGCHAPDGGDRAQQAYHEKSGQLRAMFLEQGIVFDAPFQVLFRAFKTEKVLELWVREAEGQPFRLLKTYEVCKSSGQLGPKRREGDRQVPEGFYHIDRFNPKSRYHLSLGLNYPNDSDRLRADPEHPGSDIFIHGGCKSVGCLAMTDDAIKEIYTVASEAKKRGQSTIGVHIFPVSMTDKNFEKLIETHPGWEEFWRGLKPVFDFFEKTKMLPEPDAM